MTEIFLGPNGAILRLQRENARKEKHHDQAHRKHGDQRGVVQARMIAERLIQVDARPDQRHHQQAEQDVVIEWHKLCVVLIILFTHLTADCTLGGMKEWAFAQTDPSEELAEVHFFSMKKKSGSGDVE